MAARTCMHIIYIYIYKYMSVCTYVYLDSNSYLCRKYQEISVPLPIFSNFLQGHVLVTMMRSSEKPNF